MHQSAPADAGYTYNLLVLHRSHAAPADADAQISASANADAHISCTDFMQLQLMQMRISAAQISAPPADAEAHTRAIPMHYSHASTQKRCNRYVHAKGAVNIVYACRRRHNHALNYIKTITILI